MEKVPVPTLKGMDTQELYSAQLLCMVVTGVNANLPLNTGGDPQRERNCYETTKKFKSLINLVPQ